MTAARTAAAGAAGLTFGMGLVLSDMTNPAKVLNFLDLAGTWDPSLILVMLAASAVTFAGYRLAWRRPAPLLAPRRALPADTGVDARLIGGAALFGIGWGIAGYCPGPALAAITLGDPGTAIFLGAMAAGLWAGARLSRAAPQRRTETAAHHCR